MGPRFPPGTGVRHRALEVEQLPAKRTKSAKLSVFKRGKTALGHCSKVRRREAQWRAFLDRERLRGLGEELRKLVLAS